MHVVVVAMSRSLLSCGLVALGVRKRLMSSLVMLQQNTSTKRPNKTPIRASRGEEAGTGECFEDPAAVARVLNAQLTELD